MGPFQASCGAWCSGSTWFGPYKTLASCFPFKVVFGASSTKAVAKPKGKAKAGNGKGKFKVCRGCRRKIPISELAPNFWGDWACKRALDNIYKLAGRQGPKAVEFVKECRADDDKCFNMIQSYLEACPETLESVCGKRRGQWSVVKYQERVVAAAGLVRDCIGEMQWKKLWLEFAVTARGGKLTDEAAAAKWAEWERLKEAKDPSIVFDHKGPEGALRFWVHTSDQIIFRNEYKREKEASACCS